jgi:hypothetical protein
MEQEGRQPWRALYRPLRGYATRQRFEFTEGPLMSEHDEMPFTITPEEAWKLSGDRKSIRFPLPPLPIVGLPEPLQVHLDFDAEALDEMMDRLAVLCAQMLPPSSAAMN